MDYEELWNALKASLKRQAEIARHDPTASLRESIHNEIAYTNIVEQMERMEQQAA